MPADEVSVRTAKGTTIIELAPGHTVLQLKQNLEREDAIPVCQQRLLYFGRLLANHELIEDLNVQEHTPIQCFDLGNRSSTPSASSTAVKPRPPKSISLAIEWDDNGTIKRPTVKLAPRDLVYHVKLRLKDVFKMRPQDQILYLNNRLLENGRRLSHYLTERDMTAQESIRLQLHYTGPSRDLPSQYVQLMVKTLTGNTITLDDIDLASSPWTMRELIVKKTGIAPDAQRLLFSGKQLEDDRCLLDYGLQAGSTIHLVLRLRGGRR